MLDLYFVLELLVVVVKLVWCHDVCGKVPRQVAGSGDFDSLDKVSIRSISVRIQLVRPAKKCQSLTDVCRKFGG